MKTLIKLLILSNILSHTAIAFCENDWQCYTNCNVIESITVQGDFIWCGTTGGVVCWNKSDNTYRKYTISEDLSHNLTMNIAVGGDGIIWVSHYMGASISTFDGTAWKNIEKEIPWKIKVETIAVDTDGIMWAGVSKGGVARFNGSEWKKYTSEDGLVSNEVYACAVDNSGVKWFGTKNGISSYDGSTWTSYTSENGLVADEVISMAVDKENVKWFGTKRGVSRFDGTAWFSYTRDDNLPNNNIMTIAVDNDNVKWFGTSEGLVRYDVDSWITYTEENSELPDNWINDMVIDDDGVLWLSTGSIVYFFVGNGLTSFDGTVWNNYKTEGPLYNILNCVAVDNNNVKWFGLDIGISSYDGTTWETKRTIDGNQISAIKSIVINPDNIIWFGNNISFDGVTWTFHEFQNTTQQSLDTDLFEKVYATAIDKNGVKWFGTEKGVASFDGTVWTLYNEENGFVSDYVFAIAVDSKNTKWFGTWGKGLWSFDGTVWESYTTTNSNLCYNLIQKIKVFNDVLWIIGGMGKLQSFDGITWHTYDGVEYFNARQVTDIALDNNNVLWFTTYDDGVISLNNNSPASVETTNFIPAEIIIRGNYPNPFNTQTTLEFVIPSDGFVNLFIYDSLGQKVRELVSGFRSAGTQTVFWNGKDDTGMSVSSGIYFARLVSGNQISTGRMLLLK